MQYLGIDIPVRNLPQLDESYIPLFSFFKAFLSDAREPLHIALERSDGQIAVWHTYVHGTPQRRQADLFFAQRLIKLFLWIKGGFRLYLAGCPDVCRAVEASYAPGGDRHFDREFMEEVYERPFEVCLCDEVPRETGASASVGRHLAGCRIGFDAGGSDLKVSAVVDGESVFSQEIVWFPKTNPDPSYHYNHIVEAMRSVAAHLPRVDAIGVSSAGVFINNHPMVSSLFLQVPRELFYTQVKDIYLRAGREFGSIPIAVCNDGDVTALAGSMGLHENNVLGIAMGTSEAVGYVDENGRITGWLNELAFAPVDASPDAPADEWSGDIGCGAKYLAQDAVSRLAGKAGIPLDAQASPADQLKAVQALMEQNDPRAASIYRSIGVYLAHTVALYETFYHFRHVLLLGRVMSGKGGDLLLAEAKRVLSDEYPDAASKVRVQLPDEKSRRVGQSVAAASLPSL